MRLVRISIESLVEIVDLGLSGTLNRQRREAPVFGVVRDSVREKGFKTVDKNRVEVRREENSACMYVV